jgi:diguanylate cyclase (GGDEF)-like protein
LRGDDIAARYGGEEFAILLPQTAAMEAAAIAERLRQRVEHTEFPKRRVTVSIGIASCLERDRNADGYHQRGGSCSVRSKESRPQQGAHLRRAWKAFNENIN